MRPAWFGLACVLVFVQPVWSQEGQKTSPKKTTTVPTKSTPKTTATRDPFALAAPLAQGQQGLPPKVRLSAWALDDQGQALAVIEQEGQVWFVRPGDELLLTDRNRTLAARVLKITLQGVQLQLGVQGPVLWLH